MKILTWNIQATKGCDGIFSPSRIISDIKNFGDLDVICLQEVARHIPTLGSTDQLSDIAQQFSDYYTHWAAGFSVPNTVGKPSEFGNLTLVRKPLLKNARVHNLPSPATKELQLPRTMAEVVVIGKQFDIAIFNAHLAFHSSKERIEQLKALNHLRDQIMTKTNLPQRPDASGPFVYGDTSQAVILCGDLNVSSDSSEFNEHISSKNWSDCWDMQLNTVGSARNVRQPTCGCYDRIQWPEGPHIRDYFLVTQNIAQKTNSVKVNVDTSASDHQPVFLDIAI